MSRSFGLIGLPREFKKLKEKLNLRIHSIGPTKECFYSDGYAFKEYIDSNGNIYEEFEQGCPWRGGPELYLGLRSKNDKKVICGWTNSQMGMSEKVSLPKDYSIDTKLFIKEETGPMAFGYCALHVTITESTIALSQSQSRNQYEECKVVINLLKPEDGPKIRDWLTQKGFSVVELYVD